MKILILKRDKIGDLLITTPMIEHLHQQLPTAEIHLLANDYNAWVVNENSYLTHLWVYPRTKVGRRIRVAALMKQFWLEHFLRREHFDVAIIAGGDISTRAIRRGLRVRAKRTIAYCEHMPLCSRFSDPLPAPHGLHEIERILNLLIPLGIKPPTRIIHPGYPLPDMWREFAKNWLHERSLQPQRYIVLGLGARRAKKQPTTEQILRWCAYFKTRHALDTVFMWTPGKSDNPLYPGDDEIAQPVVERNVPHIHPFRGPIMPALGLIWQARCSVFPDSGLMHFAAASPGGVIGLFAETDVSPSPLQWGPRGVRADYIEAQKSVSEVTDSEVYEKLERLLG